MSNDIEVVNSDITQRRINANDRAMEVRHVFDRALKIVKKKLINNEEFKINIELLFRELDNNVNLFLITVNENQESGD